MGILGGAFFFFFFLAFFFFLRDYPKTRAEGVISLGNCQKKKKKKKAPPKMPIQIFYIIMTGVLPNL